MDQLQQRTLFVGLTIGLAFYALGFVLPFLMEEQRGQIASLVLMFLAVAFVLGWTFAVRRGFRLGRQTRQGKRHKDRERTKPARPPRF